MTAIKTLQTCNVSSTALQSTILNVVVFLGDPFCLSAPHNVIALVRLNFHVWDEREYEFDQLVHASFSSLFQLEKALEAHQSLIYIGTELDTTIEASLFLVDTRPRHHVYPVELQYDLLLFLTNPTGTMDQQVEESSARHNDMSTSFARESFPTWM